MEKHENLIHDIKFKTSARTWSDESGLPDGS